MYREEAVQRRGAGRSFFAIIDIAHMEGFFMDVEVPGAAVSRMDYILERIETKKLDYRTYDFSSTENDAFKTYFDLAQELDSIHDFYLLCVVIPRSFFNFDASLYLIGPRTSGFMLVTTTQEALAAVEISAPPDGGSCTTERNTMLFAIRGKDILMEHLPFETRDDVLGLLEIYPADKVDPHRKLFFEKYANRIGFNLHNRFLVERNIEHLRFIRSLVADIEHNIIAPNIVYKLYLKNLGAAVNRGLEVEKLLADYRPERGRGEMEDIVSELSEVNRMLRNELDAIGKHHQNMSLFLEALLRRGHFDEGRLILRKKKCNIKREVLEPQLERYRERFERMGIDVDSSVSGVPDEETVSVVDVGLMAQVYANLFSNALKYAEEVVTASGERKKYVSYGYERLRNHFGPGRDGIKYNVYSTGPHVKAEERHRLFEDEFRGSNAADKAGTGHGLAFIKNVVEIHGGVVGYEPTPDGNNFFFILPT